MSRNLFDSRQTWRHFMNPPNSEHTPTVAVLEDDPETDQTEDEGQGEDEGASTDEEDLLVDEEETERNDDGRRVASRTITSQVIQSFHKSAHLLTGYTDTGARYDECVWR